MSEMSDLRDQLDGAICDADFDDVIAVAKKAITEVEHLRDQLQQARADLGRYDHYATQIGAKEPNT